MDQRRSRSRSPISLNIVAEDILATQNKTNEGVTHKKQRRKPTKPTSSELVNSDSESENDNEEDVEADGDVDSNGEDSIYPSGRIRQQQQHHRKRSSSRAESKKDNRSPIMPSSTNSSASSNDSSPSKLTNKHSPSIKTKNKSLTTALTIKPLTSISGIPSASIMKKKQDLDATSETTESDEECSTQNRAPLTQQGTKRGLTSSIEKSIKRHKKDVIANTYAAGEPDDLDLACGETIPGSPVHPGPSDPHNTSTDTYPREASNQRIPASSGSSTVGISTGQSQGGTGGSKSVTQNISVSSHLRSPHACTHKPTSNANQTSNRLEMPFASVPESVHGSSSNRVQLGSSASSASGNSPNLGHGKVNQTSNGHAKIIISNSPSVKGKQYQVQRGDGDIESLQGYSSTSQSPTHGDDSAGNSRSKSPPEQGDLQGDSSEVDMDSLSGRGAGSGADSCTWPGDVGGKMAIKRKPGDRLATSGTILSIRERGSRSPATGSRSPVPSSGQAGKRKKRSRKTSMSGQGGGRGRRRHGSGRNGSGMTPSRGDEDSDEDDEGATEIRQPSDSRQSTRVSSLGSLDNDALAALSQRSPRTSKFNFYVKFGKSVLVIYA